MKRLIFYCLFFQLVFTAPVNSKNNNYPYIVNSDGSKIENEILTFAKDVFYSNVFDWNDTAGLTSLKQDAYHVLTIHAENPKDDALLKNSKVDDLNFYWPRTSGSTHTFVILQKPMNWQGDWHDLYWIEQSNIVNTLNTIFQINKKSIIQNKIKALKKIKVDPLLLDEWQEPFLLQITKDNTIIAIDPGPPLKDFLSDWVVYVPTKKNTIKEYHIQFRPEIKDPKDLFKKGALKDLFSLLDQIIGIPKEWEGTLQPTLRLRLHVRKVLADAAIRPWALVNDHPYNTHEEVEANLKKWALGNKVYQNQYQQLKMLYPAAEKELASHYQSLLQYNKGKATSLAKETLDHIYRSHFIFPKAKQ